MGYNVAETKLVVDEAEAQFVRQIFELYLEHRSLLAVVKELDQRGWRTKRWTTRKDTTRGGRPFDKGSLYQLLTNVVYIGKVRYKDEVHAGEHAAIVDAGVFQKVQTLLVRNGKSGGRTVRNKHGALLRGLLGCGACNCGMSHSFSSKGTRQYRYYVCHKAQKRGWHVCPSPSVPAGEIEQFVIDQIKCIGRDPLVLKETLAQAREQAEDQMTSLKEERTGLIVRLRADNAELGRVAASSTLGNSHLVDVHERIGDAQRRIATIDNELAALDGNLIDDADVATALADFDAVWDCLAPREQSRVIELLIEQVVYDGADGNISITFRPTGIKTLASELAGQKEVAA